MEKLDRQNRQKGLIGTIVLILIAIILLKVWFHFDLIKWLMSPEIKDFFLKIWNLILFIWNEYIKAAFEAIFKSVKK